MRRNEQIRARELRVIGPEGEQLGILGRNEAIAMAKEHGLDLVEVAATADPPVCRVMDYGKFKYETQKKKQEAKKRQTVVQIKEIKVRPKTDDHDFETKVRHIKRFLEDGDRVKVTVFFRGREIVHKDRGLSILERVIADTKDVGKVEQEPRAEGRTLQMLLTPVAKKSGAQDAPAQEDWRIFRGHTPASTCQRRPNRTSCAFTSSDVEVLGCRAPHRISREIDPQVRS